MMMSLPSTERWGRLDGKRVLVRVDFNAPISSGLDAAVADEHRVRACVPLFTDLVSRGAEVVACTHLGRPGGHPDPSLSVEPLRQLLKELCPEVELMENLRFDEGEEANNEEFGRRLVTGFDYFVNEAFGVSHREHASIMIPPRFVPSAAGPNLICEVETILGLLESPKRPFVAIVGGAKVKDKIGVIRTLVEKADKVIVGGGMAYTFERAQGRTIGDSLFDERNVQECERLLETGKVVVPVDALGLRTGETFGTGGESPALAFELDIPEGHVALDIGPKSAALFSDVIAKAATILWNGPMGVFEDPRFSSGTEAVAREVASSSSISVVGGGDSVAALALFGLIDAVHYVSTGGGASLELVEFGDLPGLRALRESPFA